MESYIPFSSCNGNNSQIGRRGVDEGTTLAIDQSCVSNNCSADRLLLSEGMVPVSQRDDGGFYGG